MLSRIQLKNFKCFRDMVSVPLTGMNLFTGINGRGKSTVLQALLLMHQSSELSKTSSPQLTFNGSVVELGNFNDVKNSSSSKKEPIEFVFTFKDESDYADLHYRFKENEDDDLAAAIENFHSEGLFDGKEFEFDIIRDVNSNQLIYRDEADHTVELNFLFTGLEDEKRPFFKFVRDLIAKFKKIHYVSANRIGPQDFYPRQSTFEFPNVGARGEYTANILALAKRKHDVVPESLIADKKTSRTVIGQTEAWLSKIFDGGRIDIKTLEANIVTMQMNAEDSTTMFKPLNIGFGYSYALPIIVSGLIAKKGEMLIVENPEAHLHPHAQSQIAKFLAKVSRGGVQVYIESHSDHILNGLRVAVLNKEIKPHDLNVLYFSREADNMIVKIPVQEDGGITHWPAGFFDQTDKDFEQLFGV